MAFPGIALAAVLVAVFGGGIPVLICAIAFLYTPPVARVVRANVLAQYGEDYVTAERVIGARTPHIVLRHVAINCAAPVLVFCTVQVAEAIVFEASLSFIGAGVRPPDPSWGSVIADGKNMVLTGGWWATVFPGLLMLITVLALNVLVRGRVRRLGGAGGAGTCEVRRARRTTLGGPRAGHGQSVLALPGPDARPRARLRARARPTAPPGLPILRGREPDHRLRGPARGRGHRRRHQLRGPPGRGPGPGRRVGLRQVADGADGHGPGAEGRPGHAARSASTSGTCSRSRRAYAASCWATRWR